MLILLYLVVEKLLIKYISDKFISVPVIKHDKGQCHIYIDKDANIENAIKNSN